MIVKTTDLLPGDMIVMVINDKCQLVTVLTKRPCMRRDWPHDKNHPAGHYSDFMIMITVTGDRCVAPRLHRHKVYNR